MGEIAENCQGVKLVLVALKCDLREKHTDEDDEANGQVGARREEKEMIDYQQGLEVARRIQALRYLGRSGPAWILSALLTSYRMFRHAKPRGERGMSPSFPC